MYPFIHLLVICNISIYIAQSDNSYQGVLDFAVSEANNITYYLKKNDLDYLILVWKQHVNRQIYKASTTFFSLDFKTSTFGRKVIDWLVGNVTPNMIHFGMLWYCQYKYTPKQHPIFIRVL